MTEYSNDYGISPEQKLEPTVSGLLRIYERLAHCRYEKECCIARLNSETLAPILRRLGTKDKKNVRLTCKAFKISIDHHVGIHVNLDQKKVGAASGTLPPPGASSLRLWSIQSPNYLDHVLKRWHLITVVQFAGQISLSAFTKVVTRCRNLKTLAFTDRCHMYADIMPVKMNNLQVLDLGCPGYSAEYVGTDALVCSIWLTYEILLRKLIVPQLKTFRIFFSCVETCTILHRALAQIFRFLAAHPSIQEFCLSLHHRYERFNFLANDINFRRFRIDVPKRILRKIQLQKIQIETMEAAFRIWDSILPGQKGITQLDIVNRDRRWFYFSKLVSNNFCTLKDIRIHNVSPFTTKTAVLDAGIFSGCQALEMLFLSRFENSTQEVVYCYPNKRTELSFLESETSKQAEIENLHMLPVTLKHLHIQGIVLSTEELVATMEKLKNLQTLEFQLTGYHLFPCLETGGSGDNGKFAQGYGIGVTSKVIQKILKNCRNLEVLFIEEFENPWTKVRNTEFWQELHSISSTPGDGYFKEGTYYGIRISPNIRINCDSTRLERMHLDVDVRLSQYNFDRNCIEEKFSKAIAQLSSDSKETDMDSSSLNDSFVPTKSLLEILDNENGQLEQVRRMLSTQSPPPETPEKLKAEETRKLAQKYFSTLYCAIPNYHKASRLMEPCEKFTSYFSRPATSSGYHSAL